MRTTAREQYRDDSASHEVHRFSLCVIASASRPHKHFIWFDESTIVDSRILRFAAPRSQDRIKSIFREWVDPRMVGITN
jgi:hypothetical protein